MTRRIFSHPLTHLMLVLLVISLVQAFLVKIGSVPSISMQNTLQVGDRVLVNRTAYWGSQPQHGDIVVFSADETWGASPTAEQPAWKTAVKGAAGALGYGPGNAHYLVKRVIGSAGDTVSCCDVQGRVTVNDQPLNEAYVFEDLAFIPGTLDCQTTPRSSRCFGSVTVPEHKLLVLGDHRSHSADSMAQCRSRSPDEDASDCARWAGTDQVIGREFAVFWPLSRLGLTS
ncbi:signal peptidase I [Pseudoclavibacter sp. CFCC 13796]|uniref:signal peptidase I n=1 Tax=Pseudoclavibacter sp. CFCC 13796 TaxID=2615179 RepID=UPI0013015704|nr:signal peptidase I [Pseudoclavibacter sp. CFCC 13796]KAB1661094.1 signal peptidase I [Pseudoclavibacter sp. CFCC 13796]